MDAFTLAIVSILALTAAAWLARLLVRAALCPICTGVAGTWAWMLAARAWGLAVDPVVLALLLGASVVGGAQWMESRLGAGRSPLAWKALALPCGFAVAYGVVASHWITAAIGLCAIGALLAFFTRAGAPADPMAVAQLQERMKKCC